MVASIINLDFWTLDRLHSRTALAGDTECWRWMAYVNVDGYGKAYNGDGAAINRKVFVHRVAWVLAHGKQIPEGMTVQHLCHVRDCVNPTHLTLLPPEANSSDNTNKRKRQCKYGHENWRLEANGVHRRCVTCQQITEANRPPRSARSR